MHFPQTCELVSELVQVTGWPKGAKQYTLDGQVTLMKLSPESHLRPHTGPHNERLTAHLALIIPFGVAIRVANETRGYTELEVSVFDDSFEHEVWHRGTVGERYILYLTIHHPDLDLELEKPAHYKAFFQALDESLSVYDYDEDEYFDYDDYAEYDDQDESSDSDSTSNIYEKDDIDSEESPIHDEL